MSERQPTLFDDSPVGVSQYGTPFARRTDPVTSKIAASEQVKLASVLHRQIAQFLAGCLEPLTANEVAERIKKAYSIPSTIETIRKRVAECEEHSAAELGGHWVSAMGVRRCGVTGKLAETFGVKK